jgi:hypothetical protein
MNKYFTLRRATLLLALTLPSFCWGFGGGNLALIVIDASPDGDQTAAIAGLTPELGSASYTVSTNAGVPGGSLAGYKQIWDLRYVTALTGGDVTAYQTYLAGGGSLFLMGENTAGVFAPRDNSILGMITTLGGGTLTFGSGLNTQTVFPPFTGPNTVATVSYAGVGATTTPGTGSFITKDANNDGTAIVFPPGSLSGATSGTLVVVFDVNFLELNGTTPELQALSANMIAYLAAPGPIVPPGTPGPPSLTLVLIGLTGLLANEIRRRRVKRVKSLTSGWVA